MRQCALCRKALPETLASGETTYPLTVCDVLHRERVGLIFVHPPCAEHLFVTLEKQGQLAHVESASEEPFSGCANPEDPSCALCLLRPTCVDFSSRCMAVSYEDCRERDCASCDAAVNPHHKGA